MFLLILTQTITLAFRKGGGALGTLGFYLIIVTLFTFALGPQVMQAHAGAAMCVALLLSTVTALPLMYERDWEDGTLEQFLLQPVLLEVIVLAKLLGQWVASILPLIVVTPLLAMMNHLTDAEAWHIAGLLALASPTIIALGSIAAALTLGTRRGGLLQSLVVLPLMIPVLVFAAAGGQGATLFLGAMLLAALPISCYVTAALLRLGQE